jgi:hypothetical protein
MWFVRPLGKGRGLKAEWIEMRIGAVAAIEDVKRIARAGTLVCSILLN